MIKIDRHIVKETATIKDALIKINDIGDPDSLTLFVINDSGCLVGSLTDGDIRRGLIQGVKLTDIVKIVYNSNVHYIVSNGTSEYNKVAYLRRKKIKLVPLVDKEKHILKLLNFTILKALLPIDAVIMAGGKGTRLKPLTIETPKPLLKIGNKEIISYNFERLFQFGITNQYITVNYLKEQIIEYCKKYHIKDINFNIIEETKFLGTAGSMSLINDFSSSNILLMNSDILTNLDYEDFYKTYINQDVDVLVASIPYNVDLPYAIFNEKNQKIFSLKEKPKYIYYANAGVYLFKRKLLDLIPKGKKYNATDLINDALRNGLNVMHYPIRGYWLDIGKPDDFEKAQKDITHIDFD